MISTQNEVSCHHVKSGYLILEEQTKEEDGKQDPNEINDNALALTS